MEATKKRSINELSTDTRILINFIESNIVTGGKDFLTYREMSAAINRDVQTVARGNLNTARRYVEKQHGILLETVNTEGVKKSKDYVGTLDRTRDHLRKSAKHSLKRVLTSSATDAALTNETRIEVNARASLLGAIVLFSDAKSVKRMELAVTENQAKELPTADTIKEFMK